MSRVPTSANQQRPDRENTRYNSRPKFAVAHSYSTGKVGIPRPVLTPHFVPEDMEMEGWESRLVDLQFHWVGSCRLRVKVSNEGVKLDLREHCDGARAR